MSLGMQTPEKYELGNKKGEYRFSKNGQRQLGLDIPTSDIRPLNMTSQGIWYPGMVRV